MIRHVVEARLFEPEGLAARARNPGPGLVGGAAPAREGKAPMAAVGIAPPGRRAAAILEPTPSTRRART